MAMRKAVSATMVETITSSATWIQPEAAKSRLMRLSATPNAVSEIAAPVNTRAASRNGSRWSSRWSAPSTKAA